MGYSKKKPNRAGGRGELEEMKFPSSQGRGYWEKIQIGSRGQVEDMEFPGWQGYQRNSMCVKFPGFSVFCLGISKKGSNTNLWNIQGLSFVISGFSRGS